MEEASLLRAAKRAKTEQNLNNEGSFHEQGHSEGGSSIQAKDNAPTREQEEKDQGEDKEKQNIQGEPTKEPTAPTVSRAVDRLKKFGKSRLRFR